MKKFNLEFNEKSISASYDGNVDGESSVDLKVNFGEVYEEFMKKGEAKIDVKSLSLKREGSKVLIVLDTDKDGESVLELGLDVIEGIQEAF